MIHKFKVLEKFVSLRNFKLILSGCWYKMNNKINEFVFNFNSRFRWINKFLKKVVVLFQRGKCFKALLIYENNLILISMKNKIRLIFYKISKNQVLTARVRYWWSIKFLCFHWAINFIFKSNFYFLNSLYRQFLRHV